MDILFYLFAGVIGIAATLAVIAIWAPRPTRVRVTAVVVAALFIPLVYAQMIEMLSKPKPMSFEWYEAARTKAVVLGVSLREGKSIYLWLRPEGMTEPRYYVVPWNLKLAEKLEDMVEDAVKRNATVVIANPFLKPRDEDWGTLNVEIVPPPLPPIKRPMLPPRIFNPRDGSI
jgi:hypothetical protein